MYHWLSPFILLPLLYSQETDVPQFIVDGVTGPLSPAPLVHLTEDFSMRTGGDKGKLLAGKEWVALRHALLPLPAFLDKSVLILTNGDRLPVDLKTFRMEQDRIFFQPTAPLHASKEIQLSLNYAAVLWVDPGMNPQPSDLFLNRLRQESHPREVVFFRNGDRVEGNLKGVESHQHLLLEVNGQTRTIPWGQVAGLAFNNEFKARPRSKGPYAHLVLANGGRLGMVQPRLEPGNNILTGKTLFGTVVEVPLSAVRALDIRQGSAVYLSELAPKKYQHTPYLGLSWPLAKDAALSGGSLRLGQDTFDKGLAMHSQSRVTYDLGGSYRWFEAQVGLDETNGQRGRVLLKVLVDGKEQDLGSKKVLSFQETPWPLHIDIHKARELTLAVEYADFGDVQGQVIWANARLICK